MNWKRVAWARRLAKILMAVGVFAVALPVFVLIAAPRFADPMFGGQLETPWGLYAIGIGGLIFGLVWMWRIYKAPTKHDEALWRYRDR